MSTGQDVLVDKAYVRPSRLEDAEIVAKDLRAADKREIYTVTGHDKHEETLKEGLKTTEAYTICLTEGDVPCGLFGCNEEGVIWMVATDRILECKTVFIRVCKEWINYFQHKYKRLWNYVDSRNTLHLRWLKWCGFELKGVHAIGVTRQPFYYFERVA